MSPRPTSSALARLVVVSERDDLPGFQGPLVTADEFLAGGGASSGPRTVVVNLCRSLRYLSKGYYVSLLADARGQKPVPGVETLKGLGNVHALVRALQEADVPVVTPRELRTRRRAVGMVGRQPGRQGLVLREWDANDDVRFRPARFEETRDVVVCLGRTTSRSLRRLAAAVYRVWPAPLLRLRAMLEEETWKVVGLSPVPVHRLAPVDRERLVQALRREDVVALARTRARRGKRLALAVLHDEQGSYGASTTETIEKLERIGSRMGVNVQRVRPADIGLLADYDALFIRTLTGLNEPAFRFAARAEALGMPVIDDTQSIIRCSNKVFLHELLDREGVPTPRTYVTVPSTPYEDLERKLGLPFILKLPDGSFSTAVHKVEGPAEYRRHTREMFRHSPLVIAQAWMPTPFDWRVTTLGGRVLFVCKYHMASGHWQIRASDARGVRFGKVEAVGRAYAPRDVLRVALKAARLVGDGLYGVDVKEGPDGPLVIEVNDNPNLDTGYDDAEDGNAIYEEILEHFLRKAGARPPPTPSRAPRREVDLVTRALRRPIGPRRREIPRTPYRAYEVCGLELEYAVVDRDLNVAPLVEPALAVLAGQPTSDATLGAVGYSNEIFDHVLEIKTPVPVRRLADAERWLAEGVRRLSALLQDRFDARLMPTGMHPWFDPRRGRLWTRSNSRIYGTYERLFDVHTHGWANVQAVHVNLPAGRPHEAAAMMNAAALLVPYLPAISASSPMYAGELQPAVDNRLVFILQHQQRIPETTGTVVPEYLDDLRHYRRDVLQPMYDAVDRLPDAEAIRHEFLNARGAVFKMSRDSMEVRVLDVQECVKMDVAIAAFVRWGLAGIAQRLLDGRLVRPEHHVLVEDFGEVVRHGSRALVRAPHLRARGREAEERIPVGEALRWVLERARRQVRTDEEAYLDLVERVIEHGSLSERIAAVLEPHVADEEGFTDAARRLYVALTECLRANEPWGGRW